MWFFLATLASLIGELRSCLKSGRQTGAMHLTSALHLTGARRHRYTHATCATHQTFSNSFLDLRALILTWGVPQLAFGQQRDRYGADRNDD